MTDERMGLPSASEMWRNSKCRGNRALVRSLREKGILKEEDSSPDSRLGEDIHRALVPGEQVKLEAKAEETKNECDRLATLAAATYLGRDPEPLDRVLYEQRFWYHIGETPFFSGKPDRVYLDPCKILDVNFKTGREEEEQSNVLQLRTEVVLLKHCYPEVEEIAAVPVQPWVTHTPEITVYGEEELHEATVEILEIVDGTFWSVDREAGPWCKWCPGRAFCPEARQLAMKHPPIVNVEALPVGQDGAEMLETVMVAGKILKALKEAYKQRVITEPGCIPGWHISDGDRKRSWTDIGAALQKANEFLILEQYADVPFGRLESALQVQWGQTGKAFERQFEKEFGDLITVTRAAGELQKVPKRLR